MGQAHFAGGPGPGHSSLRPRAADSEATLPAELDDGPPGHLRGQRPAMPALAVFDLGEPAALSGTGQDHGGTVRVGHLAEGLVDLAEVVAVDDNSAAAEPLHALDVGFQVPAQLRRAALAETVHVNDRGQVAEPVVRRLVERLPHRALGHLAIAA